MAGSQARLVFRLLAAAVGALLAAAQPAAAIVGASTEGTTVAPLAVMVLQRSGRVAGFCSGVVVRQDAVLTAAHCAPEGAALAVHYRDGTAPVLRDVAAVVRHPGFRPDAVARRQRSIDLALLRLAEPLPPPFRPATLGAAAGVAVGAGFRLAGFGLRREGEPASAGQLRLADVAARAPLSDILLWAADGNGTGACTGDSGGPVLLPGSDTVVGVVAWSSGEGARHCGTLTQAIWLAPQRAWIDGVLDGWAAKP